KLPDHYSLATTFRKGDLDGIHLSSLFPFVEEADTSGPQPVVFPILHNPILKVYRESGTICVKPNLERFARGAARKRGPVVCTFGPFNYCKTVQGKVPPRLRHLQLAHIVISGVNSAKYPAQAPALDPADKPETVVGHSDGWAIE